MGRENVLCAQRWTRNWWLECMGLRSGQFCISSPLTRAPFLYLLLSSGSPLGLWHQGWSGDQRPLHCLTWFHILPLGTRGWFLTEPNTRMESSSEEVLIFVHMSFIIPLENLSICQLLPPTSGPPEAQCFLIKTFSWARTVKTMWKFKWEPYNIPRKRINKK